MEVIKGEIMELPLLPLRGTVIFPGVMLSFDVGRERSLKALKTAVEGNQLVCIVPQLDVLNSDPGIEDFVSIGVIAEIKNQLSQPSGIIRVTVKGLCKAEVKEVRVESSHFSAVVEPIREIKKYDGLKCSALMEMIKNIFNQTISWDSDIPDDLIVRMENENDPEKFADLVSYYFISDNFEKQVLLLNISIEERLEYITKLLLKEVDIAYLKTGLIEKLKDSVDEENRKYYLRQQLKVILEELGDGADSKTDADELKAKFLKLPIDNDVKEKLIRECKRLSNMPYDFQEANIVKTYLDTCVALPWGKFTKDNVDIIKARKILDKDHYGLDKAKDKIIELLAIRKLSDKNDGQIICLVGPPGVGKTSIAQSIAKAVGKKYVRISLGGVRDEAEIRGHRKTYVGAMPGRVISAIRQAGTSNPLLLLDEIDKLGRDAFGDPTSAMLEVLDPEQNFSFFDHYLDIPFDLSKVLFVVTANDYDAIPSPLLDRMDVIRIDGYTHEEKFNIARKYLIPKNMKKSGLTLRNIKIEDEALNILIDGYTREAGVRNLERKIMSLFGKAAKNILSSDKKKIVIDKKVLQEMLGPQKYRRDKMNQNDQVGVARGLAWTAMGGETMPIEVAILKGNGKVHLTGSLGDVMKESADIAISCVRSMAGDLGIKENFYKKNDIHIHVPEGAVPKDGPSAGITLATSVISALTGVPVRRDVAMTGEITLRGRVLPIGGLKEKTMAAYITGIQDVILPKENEPDLYEVDEAIKSKLNFIFAENLDTVIDNALVDFKNRGANYVEEDNT